MKYVINYNKEYYKKHKPKMQQQMVEWRKNHKKEMKEYARKYYQKHKAKILTKVKKYKQTHKIKVLQNAREYAALHKTDRLEYIKEYQLKHKTKKRYYDKKYRTTTQGKIIRSRANNKRRRSLGYNLLNKPFNNSVGHHINNIDVVHIPLEIHKRFYNPSTQKHRDSVLQYYGNIENMVINKALLVQNKTYKKGG